VAIYFDSHAASQLWERLVDSLAPGGVLVTGKAEKPSANLPLTRLAKCIYRRKEAPTLTVRLAIPSANAPASASPCSHRCWLSQRSGS
jgi:hypothetical protein